MGFIVNPISSVFGVSSGMVLNLFIYLSLLTSLVILPDRFWSILWQKTQAVRREWARLKMKSPWGKEEREGDRLLIFFPELEAKISMGVKTTSVSIPTYKFYTSLLYELLEQHRRLGISLKAILPELRGQLILDLHFEKKMSATVVGGNLQFAVIALTTWGFIFLSSALADLPVKLFDFLVIGVMQLLAVMVFNWSIKKARSLIFLKYSKVFEGLYLFNALVEVGSPVGKALSESKILEGDLVAQNHFSLVSMRVKELVKLWAEKGLSPRVGLSEVARELWHKQEMDFLKFLKVGDYLKFGVLAGFFLPAYFYYLYTLFQHFLSL